MLRIRFCVNHLVHHRHILTLYHAKPSDNQDKSLIFWLSFASQRGIKDVVTLFHDPSSAASVRVHTFLKQASAQQSATATLDQASEHPVQGKEGRTEYELGTFCAINWEEIGRDGCMGASCSTNIRSSRICAWSGENQITSVR